MSELIMEADGKRFIVRANPQKTGFDFYKCEICEGASCFSYIASIIDTGSGFRLQRNRLFHRGKKLDKNKEIIWTNKNGIVTDDEESQIDLITVYGNKMIARFPDVEPKQNAFLIGYYDSKTPVKLIADVRLNHTLKFTFDL